MWLFSASEAHYWCLSAINCTGQNMSKDLLLALSLADANMYLCLPEIQSGKRNLLIFYVLLRLLYDFR